MHGPGKHTCMMTHNSRLHGPVVSYFVGVPLIPTALNLDPNPDDLTRLIFSWVIPADAMAGVNLTYTPAITGPSFNISDTTIDNVIVFTDDASLDCQLHDFSVFASNEAGRGPTSSITETIPIC